MFSRVAPSLLLAAIAVSSACSSAPPIPASAFDAPVSGELSEAPATLQEALVGPNTAALLRFRTGRWGEFSNVVDGLEAAEANHALTELAQMTVDDGAFTLLRLANERLPPDVLTLFTAAEDDRDAFIRIDVNVDTADRILFERGLYLMPPPRALSPAYTVTVFVPTEKPDAAIEQLEALVRDRPAVIAKLDDYVVLRQTTPAAADPGPLFKARLPASPALEGLLDSDAPLNMWFRPEHALWGHALANYQSDCNERLGDSLTGFASQHLDAAALAAAHAFALPVQGIEVKEWLLRIDSKGSGAVFDLTSSYTPAGEAAVAVSTAPKSAPIPSLSVPDEIGARVFLASKGAVSLRSLADWPSQKTADAPDFSGETGFEFDDIAEVSSKPAFWAAPLQLAIRRLAPEALADVADTVSWSLWFWRNDAGESSGVLAMWLPASPEEIRAATTYNDEVRAFGGGSLVLATDAGVAFEVADFESWSQARVDRFSLDYEPAKYFVDAQENIMGALSGRLNVQVGETGYQAQLWLDPANDAVWRPLELRELKVQPIEPAACQTDARRMLASLIGAGRPRQAGIDEQFDEIDKTLIGCEAPGVRELRGRVAWLHGLHLLDRAVRAESDAEGGETMAAAAFDRACRLGVKQACDEPLEYYSGRACPRAYFRQVVVAAEPLPAGTRLEARHVERACRTTAEIRPNYVLEDELDWALGQTLETPLDRGAPLDTASLKR